MRMKLVLTMMAVLILASGAFAAEHDQGKLTKLADGVYAYVGVPSGTPYDAFGANVGVIVGDDSVLVVDTLTSANEAKVLVEEIRKITDKPIKYVVNTHYHLDHALGNNVFDDMGAVIIAHEKCRDSLVGMSVAGPPNPEMFGLPADFWEGTRITAPQITFTQGYTLDLGNMPVQIVYSGVPSHSAGSVIVVVPERDVMFTGDILFTDFHPYLGEGDFAGWAFTLDFIADMGISKIVPGHGPLSDKRDLEDMKEYLVLFDAKAKELCATMQDPAKISVEMLKVLPERKDGAFIVGMNIGVRYLKKPEGEGKY